MLSVRSRPRPAASCAVALVAGALLLAGTPAAAEPSELPGGTTTARPGLFLVTLGSPPAAAYAGGVDGLARTRPAAGERFDRTRPQVAAYTSWLRRRQDAVLEAVGASSRDDVVYRYTTAVDGFAARLTSPQVSELRSSDRVVRVERATLGHVDSTATAPDGRGSRVDPDGPESAWRRVGGPARAGRGVVIGVVDSGIWPDNPGFGGLPEDTPGTAPGLPGFHGACAPAEQWGPADCSDKVVSARWFARGFGPGNVASSEYLSPRDGTGHGSHVASVAAGDHGIRVRVDGQRLGTVSGTAPAARVAVYKACWAAPDPAGDGCSEADTVAAVDHAVADGVDVLNYSVADGSRAATLDEAFLGAASAGVLVTAAAGNHGPRAGTVGHDAPWVTTVAASTVDRFTGTVHLGDGRALPGSMASRRRVAPTRLLLAGTAAAPGVASTAARHCETGSLDASAVEGAVVVCDRGRGSRVDKSATVDEAGGAAMVLANTRPQSTEADVHTVPTVHLDAAEAAEVKAYARRAGSAATASVQPSSASLRPARTARFSSRGPTSGFGGGVLKPDLSAPGLSVLGAVAPPSDSGRAWDLASGTSASAPYVAGLAALVLGARPHWSPARVRSALTTTASDVPGAGPLAQGAGQVDPARVLDPGLVLDASASAWRAVAAGTRRARDVNTPSVAVGRLRGPTTVTRRITNVSGHPESYAARVSGLPGVDLQAFPATVLLAPGETRTVRLRITARPSTPSGRDVTGWLVWRGSRHRVRIPLWVRPVRPAALR